MVQKATSHRRKGRSFLGFRKNEVTVQNTKQWVGSLEPGDLVNAKEGAALLGCSVKHFYRVAREPAIKVPGLGLRWLRADLAAFMVAHRRQGGRDRRLPKEGLP